MHAEHIPGASPPVLSWTLHPAVQLPAHAADWDRLQTATTRTPFLQSAFLLPLLATFGQGGELLALGRAHGQLRAAALLRPKGYGQWETFQPSQLPLGAWVGHGDDDIAAAAHSLLPRLPGLALTLGLTQIDPHLLPRPPDSAAQQSLDYVATAHVPVQGPFDAYWEARGKNLRQNTKKQRNKLLAEGTTTQLECLTRPDEMAAALLDYGQLESAGWKAGTGTAVAPDNAQGRFYRAMLEGFAAQGHARIYRYRFGDKVVATDLCIDNGSVIVILKTAYDESYRTISPSILMRQEEFAALFDGAGSGPSEGSERIERIERIEFYGKVMEWHTRWTDLQRTLYHLNVYRWPLLQRLHALRQRRRDAAAAAAATAAATPAATATEQPDAAPRQATAPVP